MTIPIDDIRRLISDFQATVNPKLGYFHAAWFIEPAFVPKTSEKLSQYFSECERAVRGFTDRRLSAKGGRFIGFNPEDMWNRLEFQIPSAIAWSGAGAANYASCFYEEWGLSGFETEAEAEAFDPFARAREFDRLAAEAIRLITGSARELPDQWKKTYTQIPPRLRTLRSNGANDWGADVWMLLLHLLGRDGHLSRRPKVKGITYKKLGDGIVRCSIMEQDIFAVSADALTRLAGAAPAVGRTSGAATTPQTTPNGGDAETDDDFTEWLKSVSAEVVTPDNSAPSIAVAELPAPGESSGVDHETDPAEKKADAKLQRNEGRGIDWEDDWSKFQRYMEGHPNMTPRSAMISFYRKHENEMPAGATCDKFISAMKGRMRTATK